MIANKYSDSLEHYASKYYDPQKAHEYYIKNRELKGRRTGSALSDEGKQKWNYVKEEISKEKKEKISEETNKTNSDIEDLRYQSKMKQREISDKLRLINKYISADAKEEKEKIAEQRDRDIKAIREVSIPEGLSDDQKKIWIERRNELIDKIRNTASDDKDTISENASDMKYESRQLTNDEKDSVREEVKSAILAAKTALDQVKNSIDESFEEVFQSEYEKIKSENPKILKTKSKKSKTSSKSKTKKSKQQSEAPVIKKAAATESDREVRQKLLKKNKII